MRKLAVFTMLVVVWVVARVLIGFWRDPLGLPPEDPRCPPLR
jgi:hypothetical protein